MKIASIALAALSALAFAPQTPPQRLDPSEPPHRVELRIGARRVQLELGVTRPASDGIEELHAEFAPTRKFVAPSAFSFEFPREWVWSGGASGAAGWWSVTGEGWMVHLQRHEQDPEELRDLYVRNSLACGAAEGPARTFALDGREIRARSVEHAGVAVGRIRPMATRQYVLAARAGGASWLIVLQSPGDTQPSYVPELVFSDRFAPAPRVLEAARPLAVDSPLDPLDSIAAHWRWL